MKLEYDKIAQTLIFVRDYYRIIVLLLGYHLIMTCSFIYFHGMSIILIFAVKKLNISYKTQELLIRKQSWWPNRPFRIKTDINVQKIT